MTTVSGGRTENYSYDLNGNRTMPGYQTGPANRLASDGTYSYEYDNEGNLLRKTRLSDGQVTEFVWDYRNRLSGVIVKDASGQVVQETVFTYDVFDRRIGKGVDADGAGPGISVQQWTVYDGVNPYADFAADGSLTTRYVADPRQWDGLLACVGGDGVPQWYLRDNINSVRQIVGPDGTVLNAITYDSFGNVISETNPAAGDRFQYTGREYDAELGIYYYRARYYDPSTGRFLAEDPLSFAAGDSNLYRYVGNQPNTRVDPSGMDYFETDQFGLWYVRTYTLQFWRSPKRIYVGYPVNMNGHIVVRVGAKDYVPLHVIERKFSDIWHYWNDLSFRYEWVKENGQYDFSTTYDVARKQLGINRPGVDLRRDIYHLHADALDAYDNQYVTGLAVTAVGLGAIATYRGYRSWQLARAPASTKLAATIHNASARAVDNALGKQGGPVE